MIPQPPGPDADEFRRWYAIDLSTLSGEALMRVCAYRNPIELSGTGIVNTRHGRAAEMPSTNGHGNARAVARLYAALAGDGRVHGVHILAPDIIRLASTEQVYGDDLVLQRPTRFGLGFQLPQPERRLGPSARAFGHFGAGGSLGFADPDRRVSFGYAMNQGQGRLAAQARAPSDRPGVRRALIERTADSMGYRSIPYSLSLRQRVVRPMPSASAASEWLRPNRSRVWRMWACSASASVIC